jgi:hypothetical protein
MDGQWPGPPGRMTVSWNVPKYARKGTLIIKTTDGRHEVMGLCYLLALGGGSILKYIGASSDDLWIDITFALKRCTGKAQKTLCLGQVYSQRAAIHGGRPQYF